MTSIILSMQDPGKDEDPNFRNGFKYIPLSSAETRGKKNIAKLSLQVFIVKWGWIKMYFFFIVGCTIKKLDIS